ncbi:twin transmembrane helix small protein [Parasphingopyxis marina]|uniref:Twin transmembrane helix small protein n=1 Tax=Parasphingopyxis marina TaxID=2761622 RepID=A0A842HV98_9SPHN|nr:twin transmembrane helix small protein [Parasphingopyxis marina]MBC2776169.1 twin transmembrane helix small protein [Parasphingopyxis marina]
MQIFLIILLVAAMAATLFFLVRGIVQFLKTTEEDLLGDGPNRSGQLQNKAMQGRIAMQAIAVVIVLLLLLLMGR